MAQYVKGTKRLAIIKRWLQGIDDPEYDVFPTRKEGRYIVKKRDEKPQEKQSNEPIDEQPEDDEHDEQDEPEEPEEQQPVRKSSTSKPKQPIRKSKAEPGSRTKQQTTYDSTVNLEILEQLKLLGDEIRSKRERKEQKKLIKHVVEKQLSKKPQTREYEYEYYSDDDEQPVFKSRIRR